MGVKIILEIPVMLTLLEWEQTQSSKNCVFIKAHEHTTLLLFSKNTLQVQFCNWKKAKGGFPGYLILASITCLEIRESHLTFLLAGALCHSWLGWTALPGRIHSSSSSLYHEWCSCLLHRANRTHTDGSAQDCTEGNSNPAPLTPETQNSEAWIFKLSLS